MKYEKLCVEFTSQTDNDFKVGGEAYLCCWKDTVDLSQPQQCYILVAKPLEDW